MTPIDRQIPLSPARPRRLAPASSPALVTVAAFVGVLVLWEGLARTVGTSAATGASILPTIPDTFSAFPAYANYWIGGLGAGDTRMGAQETLWGATLGLVYNLGATLMRLLAGLLLGVAAGVGLAFVLSWSGILRDLLAFPAHFLRMMPLLALIPLFAMWFSDKNVGGIVFVMIAVFVLMFAATLNAVRNAPVDHVRFARALGGSARFVYINVVFPGILPELRGGFLLSLGFSWNATLASEFLGQRYGVGAIVMNAQEFGRMDLIMLSALVCIICASASFLVANRLFTWLVRWAD